MTFPHPHFRRLAMPGLGCALLAILSGCRTPDVGRAEETARFSRELQQRTDALKLDPAAPLTPDRCVAIAVANGLDYRIRQLRETLGDDRVRQSLADALPRVDAGWQTSSRNNDALMNAGGVSMETEDRTMRAFSVRGVLPVLDWGTTYYGWQIAKDRQRQERLMLERARQLLERDVRVAHARLAAAQRQERMGRVAVLGAQELVRVARSLEREGLDSRASTAEIEAALAQVVQTWTELRRGVEKARLQLAQTMSLPAGAAFTIDDRLPELPGLPPPEQAGAIEDRALAGRPEMSVQDRERRIAASTVRREIANFIPHLDLFGGYSRSSFSLLQNPGYWSGGVQVTDSLLNGGRNWWSYQMAKKNVRVEEERTLLLSLGLLYEVDFSLIQLYSAHDAMVSRGAVVRSRMESLKLIASRFRLGLESGSEAARALANLYLAYLQEDRDRADYQIAWAELDAAAPPLPGEPPPAAHPAGALPAFVPAPAITPFAQIPDLFPGIDLTQFPEVHQLMKDYGTAPPPEH